MTMVMAYPRCVKSLATADLERALPAFWIEETLRQLGGRFRTRQLPPGLSVHLLLLQLLHQTALQGLRHLVALPATVAAVCQARSHLPLALFYRLVELLTGRLLAQAQVPAEALFYGLQVLLLDATSTRTADTPKLARCYGKCTNHRKITPGFPAPKLLCLMHAASGLILRVIDLPAWRQEHMVLRRLLKYLGAGRIVLADRGLVSFTFLAELLGRQAHACLRLPAGQIARYSGARRILQELGPADYLVHWDKGSVRGEAYGRRAFAALPKSLRLRQITCRVERPGFRVTSLTLITTLLDPAAYPAADVVALYRQRWQIEVYFRDLKRTQGLLPLRARTLAGVRKELLGHVLLYNLIRAAMMVAARQLQLPADRLSFLEALRRLRHAAPWLTATDWPINARRHRPCEPRRVKTRRSKYPPLNKPRGFYKIPLPSRAP